MEETKELGFPRRVMKVKAGVVYSEMGPNTIKVHTVIMKDENGEDRVELVTTVAQDDLTHMFVAMSKGLVIRSYSVADDIMSEIPEPLEEE